MSESLPKQIRPYIIPKRLDDELVISKAPFEIVQESGHILDVREGCVSYRWSRGGVVFCGRSDKWSPGFDLVRQCRLRSRDPHFEASAIATRTTLMPKKSEIEGVVNQFDIGTGPFDRLQFFLANFPKYFGESVRSDQAWHAGRLVMECSKGFCTVDAVHENRKLADHARRQPGYVVTHIGEWTPKNGDLHIEDIRELIPMLWTWFGFLRGDWSGPLFQRGLREDEVVWKQFGPWPLGSSRRVRTWLPEKKKVELSPAFDRFTELWNDDGKRSTIELATTWYVEANSSTTASSRILLSQAALELLASEYDVKDVNNAATRIRDLLTKVGIDTSVPDRMEQLKRFKPNKDGPGVISTVRNKITHAKKGKKLELSARTMGECADLAIGYVELSLLHLLGYEGHYSLRRFEGWKGADEVLVPWA